MPKVIWNKSDNPPRYVSDELGIERWQLREAIHKIKMHSGLRGAEHIIIFDDGAVTDSAGGPLGNIYDEI